MKSFGCKSLSNLCIFLKIATKKFLDFLIEHLKDFEQSLIDSLNEWKVNDKEVELRFYRKHC
jgi:hypothetical protein